MNKLLICLGTSLALGLAEGAWAQHSIHSPYTASSSQLEYLQHTHQYIGLHALSLREPLHLVSSEDVVYIERLSEYIRRGASATHIIEDFCSDANYSIDLQRARLLLGIAYFRNGEDANALSQLNVLHEDGLYRYEADKSRLLRAYLYLASTEIKAQPDKAKALLLQATRGNSIWAEQASLYESNLLWAEGKPHEAMSRLESRMWSNELMPEVEYTGALLAYSLGSPQDALKQTEDLRRKYPEQGKRPRLVGLEAQVYYQQGRYADAISLLDGLYRAGQLLPEEAYTLGASYYSLHRYTEALSPLQYASEGGGAVAPMARFAIANIYRQQGDSLASQLALEQVAKDVASSPSLREQALYQLIELGYQGGQDAFGGQISRVEQFLASYPSSQYRSSVLELFRGYIARSTNYEASRSLIDRLEKSGVKLGGLKQEVLVRWAERIGRGNSSYLPLLTEAIALGPQTGGAYYEANLMRAESLLSLGRYARAEADARTALSLGSTEPLARYLLGYALYNQKKYGEAAHTFQSIKERTLSDRLQSDAYLRVADCYAEGGRNTEAIDLYRKADAMISGGSEQALYRLALLYSKLGRHKEQIETAHLLEQRFPQSIYRAELLYRRGRSELLMGQVDNARRSFADVQRLYPNSEVAPTALMDLALIEGNADRDEEAMNVYKKLINTYPDTKEAESALSDLRSLYAERNALDDYASYVRSLGRQIGKHPEDEAHLSFISIESKLKRGETGTTALLEQYLSDYPKGADRLQAERLLVQQYLAEGRSLDALRHIGEARRVASGEDAIALAITEGDLQMELAKPVEAHQSYLVAYKLSAGTKMYRLNAGLKVLRSASGSSSKEYLSIADELLSRSDLSNAERSELFLIRGRLQQSSGANREARESYAQVGNDPNSVYVAEAIVRRADIALQAGQTTEAEKALKAFVSSGSAQTYWLARAFLLLADCYEKQGDLYMAKQYVESLQENYTGEEKDIQTMITTRLKRYNK